MLMKGRPSGWKAGRAANSAGVMSSKMKPIASKRAKASASIKAPPGTLYTQSSSTHVASTPMRTKSESNTNPMVNTVMKIEEIDVKKTVSPDCVK